MPIDWEKIAKDTDNETFESFVNRISSLTRLNDHEIITLVNETGISEKNLAEVLKEVKSATKSNTQKADAIKKISSGVNVLVEIASKLI
ncbi:hypothetical protein [Maribellus mangrovi]|uniref:hypothetical protein n=1 Tax=Maribellus mangrovi TaxID=3133146 RepID=UPI0030EC210E